MGKYADATRVKERSGVSAADLALTDRDSDADTDEADLDALIAELNRQASESIEAHTRRDFELHDGGDGSGVTVEIDGNGRSAIRLPGYPVQQVHEVKVGETTPKTLDASTYRVRSNPARPGENAGVLERKRAVWPQGWENVVVTYTWGYNSPPGPVEQVAEELVVQALQKAAHDDTAKGATSLSLDGFSVQIPGDALRMSLDEQQQASLDDYKRVVVA